MKLLGMAVIGKGNQPLYLCDCTKIAPNNDSSADNDNHQEQPQNDDYYGFGIIPETVPDSRSQGESMCMDHQFMIHASLDRLEELVGSSKPDGTMPLRRNSYFSQYLGLLVVHDGVFPVYGHVTATNIKLLALCEPSADEMDEVSFSQTTTHSNTSSRNTNKLSETQQRIKTLLATIHRHYVDYVMNPFSDTVGTISSPRFDANVREAVAQY